MRNTTDFEVLDAKKDAERWYKILRLFPEAYQDIYFTPEYLSMHCDRDDVRALLFVYQAGADMWIYPCILRLIPQREYAGFPDGYCDIESAYGYGGPLSSTNEMRFLDRCHGAFSAWCLEHNVVAEFIRFHPIIENRNWILPETELVLDRQTVSLDLATIDEDMHVFDPKARNKVRRALNSGVEVGVRNDPEDFAEFVNAYLQTMQRLRADDEYYFTKEYFTNLEAIVRHSGDLLVAEIGGKFIAATVLLRGNRILNYHLSCTVPEKSITGVVNLLIRQAGLAGKQLGLDVMHLGGGRGPEPQDSLYQFKQSMGTNTHQFYIGKRIHNSDLYKQLCSIWRTNFPELESTYGNRLLCYRYTK